MHCHGLATAPWTHKVHNLPNQSGHGQLGIPLQEDDYFISECYGEVTLLSYFEGLLTSFNHLADWIIVLLLQLPAGTIDVNFVICGLGEDACLKEFEESGSCRLPMERVESQVQEQVLW